METLISFFKGFGLSFLFIALGVYILMTTTSVFAQIIGVGNIVYFSGAVIIAIFKMIKNKT